jgi:hypothetical protein
MWICFLVYKNFYNLLYIEDSIVQVLKLVEICILIWDLNKMKIFNIQVILILFGYAGKIMKRYLQWKFISSFA